MAASDWAPAVGAGLGAAIGFGSAVWVQTRAWREEQRVQARAWGEQERTRWDERTLNTYAAFLQTAAASFNGAILFANSNQSSPSTKQIERFKEHFSTIEIHYEALVLLAPASREEARRIMWTLWNLSEQKIPESRNPLLATHTYRDARFHLRVGAQERFKIAISEPVLTDECDESTHESPLGRSAMPLGSPDMMGS
jgi:hypothetical protein